jgi:transposase
MPARDLKRLAREIAAAKQWFELPATRVVRSCYEAGRDEFWLHWHLTSIGIDNRVVDSSSIEVNRRQRRAKSDGLEVRKLLGMLVRYHAGESKVWSVLRVPTVEEEDRRQLHRELRDVEKGTGPGISGRELPPEGLRGLESLLGHGDPRIRLS